MRKDVLNFANEKYFNGHSNSHLVQGILILYFCFNWEAANMHIPSKTSIPVSSIPWVTHETRWLIRKKGITTYAKTKKTGSSWLITKFQELRKFTIEV